MTAALDHLVVAGVTLAQAIEYFADLTGVAPRPGGQHLAVGTHNALVHLGDKTYLELIAIDPTLPKPARPRWFDLDDTAMQVALAERPRLVSWLARTSDIERTVAKAGYAAGPIHPMSRGDFRWRITIPADGRRAGDGVLPGLIQWDVEKHPADGLPNDGVSLIELAASHPDPQSIRKALASVGLQDAMRVSFGSPARLAAMLRTPRGLVTL